MKLRILDNSLRLRLTQSEVQMLASTGRVAATTSFGPGAALGYALEASRDVAETIARFDGGHVTVTVPEQVVRTWSESAQVGIEKEQPVGGGRVLTVLVEKDFKCLHGAASRVDADAFPNPNA